ncbi:hypothetical protein SDC9_141154 [bioreactor metagenome]|uniref:HTH cro/C1-type domain-containing protein n=1 Tax=bioreactor metagenome TaxID=1076179 RepID=A0A645E095_9ZZZZ|nr:helix-turn-helix transcriptional regulator [Cloacibacillus evryensis]MEA5033998.1 helix-turn-helix transcriptional regulator [Cloacibacillus evryensis]
MNRLKEFREKEGLTQLQLAEISGVSLRSISRIESEDANFTRKTGEKLAEVLNCAYADLIAAPTPPLEGTSTILSAEEEDLIELFRGLDKKGKEELAGYLSYQKYRAKTSKKSAG